MQKTLLIFDIDGTLLYSNKIDSQCFAQTYTHIYGRPFPTIDWRKYPAVSDTTIFATVIRDHFERAVDPAEVVVFQEAFVQLIQEKRIAEPAEFQEVPGARTAIMKLMAMEKFVLGIGTGGWKAPAMVKLNHLDIPTTGMAMAFADGNFTREAILEESITLAKSKHDDIGRIVYVGDAIWDVETTRNMGLPFIGIRRKGDEAVLKSAGSHIVLRNFVDFDHFLLAVAEAEVPAHPS